MPNAPTSSLLAFPGQVVEPSAHTLLDCDTPSGATCGAVRRTIRTQWIASPPVSGRHTLLLDLDENDIGHRSFGSG